MGIAEFELALPFVAQGGSCWSVALSSELFPESDNPEDPSGSLVILTEDGVELGPAHTAHQLIIRDGGGSYSHWRGQLHFSTTDNSDPNDNGRRYSVRRDPRRYFVKRAEHAAGIVESYLRRLPGDRTSLQGARILEIGPGRDMGTILILAGLGASSVAAVDRFAGLWQPGWHDQFIDALVVTASARLGIDVSEIAAEVKKAQSFSTGHIALYAQPFEEFDRTDLAFDATFSHSVFEHFYAVDEAARALFSVSAPGSYGAHHVDFRDHRNFGEPLEFLLIADERYRERATNDDYGRGNRTRADEMTSILISAGFSQVELTIESSSPLAYLTSFEPRLRSSKSRFRAVPLSGLGVLSGGYLLSRAR